MRRNPIFRKMENLERDWNRARFNTSTRHRLTDQDYSDFNLAGDVRQSRPVSPQTIAEVEHRLKSANIVRWMRLKHDIKWAKRQLKKMGRNPEDLRMLL